MDHEKEYFAVADTYNFPWYFCLYAKVRGKLLGISKKVETRKMGQEV